MSLLRKANRDEFKVDEAKYLDRYKLTSAHREAILKRQWNRMLELGGNIYFAPARRFPFAREPAGRWRSARGWRLLCGLGRWQRKNAS
jgi:hypothetical protein